MHYSVHYPAAVFAAEERAGEPLATAVAGNPSSHPTANPQPVTKDERLAMVRRSIAEFYQRQRGRR